MSSLPEMYSSPDQNYELQYAVQGLIKALTKDQWRDELLQGVDSLDDHKLIDVLDDLGLITMRKDISRSIFRGRRLLSRTYGQPRIDRYKDEYIERMLIVLPGLYANGEHSSNAMPEKQLRRYNQWVNGSNSDQISLEENLTKGTVLNWANNYFPRVLSSKVSFFDVVHAADLLTDAEDAISRPKGPSPQGLADLAA